MFTSIYSSKRPWYKRGFTAIQERHEFHDSTSVSQVTQASPAAHKHPEVAAAAEDDDAADAAAATSSPPAVAAEVLDAAVEAAERAPDPVRAQGHFQVSALLKEVSKNLH